MRLCPYCGYSNSDPAELCRKCEGRLVAGSGTQTLPRTYWFGPRKSKLLRDRALSFFILGLLIKVYWGGYGPWPVADHPMLASLRVWLEPLLLVGGAILYLAGLVLYYV